MYDLCDWFREGLVVIKGLPGVGKTLLAAKAATCFNKVAWFTFYETAERLAKYLASAGLNPPLHVFDLVSVKENAAAEYLVEKVLELRPDAVVIDGINALASEIERELLHAVFYHGLSRDGPVIVIKEGTEVTPTDYVADTIIEVEHKIFEDGVSIRHIKILKARGRSVRYASLPYIITEESPVVVLPREESREPPTERFTTGAPELDQALNGGVLKGSMVAVVGPPDGLASKLMVLTAVALTRSGHRVLYHHHKVVPTFVKFAEALGVNWRLPGLTWRYHPVADHKSLAWWYKSASMINREKYDVHFADQYEQVAVVAGKPLLIEAARLYQSTLTYPVTTVLVFNSHDVWRDVAKDVGSLADYVFIFRRNTLTAYAPDIAEPLRFKFTVDWNKRRVIFAKT